ncbi:hypothetical protein KAM447_41950 [Aeromonas caviae]|uniref:hypothetical protein n=1 Tax=Aeromonas caviae TaxID=648 RepID=UPI001FC87CF3|nr:hypothetical protein [Aeromonas caviae]GKQ77687.1 hypothetical protein KAM447_41950 [Aeromonas caviae]
MGANNASLGFLYKFQQIDPWHPLVIGRLITRLHSSKDFPEIISLLDYLPFRQQEDVLTVNSVRRILIDISKFMLCDTILLKFGGFTEEIRWIHKQRADMAQYSLQDIPSLIAAENYGLAQKLIAYFYSAGVRTLEFFKLASSPMKSEFDSNSRVIFFRIEAEKHCTDAKISELAARSYLHIGEVEKALHVLRRAISKRCYSEQIIYLFTMVLTLLGRPLDELLLAGFFGMPDYAKVSDFIKKSSFNKSINSGDFVEADFISNELSHGQSNLWRCSTPLPMITRSYDRGRVALCLSGQVRAFDEPTFRT